jgi:hypothetical protein
MARNLLGVWQEAHATGHRIMPTFSPELAPRWLANPESARRDARDDGEAVSAAQQETLEALADRISAARAIA